MKKYLLISFLMFLGFFNARSQVSDGTYGFLNTTHSARVAALGGTLVPIQDSDIQLTVFNPALINTEMNNAIALSYVDYYSDINFASIQYGRTFDKIGSFVATVQFQNYGRFYYADESGYTDGTVFSPSDYCFTLGWGRQLNPKLSIGANLRFGGLQYEQYSTFAILVDVAANYDLGNDLMLSAAVRNVGDELYNNLDGVKSTLPFRMQLGMSKKLEHLPFLFMIVYDNLQKWDLSYDDPLDLEGNYDPITGETREKSKVAKFANNFFSHIVVAGELYIGKNLVIRASYNYGLRQTMKTPTKKGLVGFSYGVGLRLYKFNINYSRSEMHIHGAPNYISITTNLDRFVKSKNKTVE